jgi:serine/threonine protein kinase
MAIKEIGKYKIVKEVGRGGMAVVYKAKDKSLGRVVALKLLHPYLAEDEQARRRLKSEAKAVASLHHDLIPEVYDFSGEDVEHAYIVTEFIEGVTLSKYLKKHTFDLSESGLLIFHRIVTALNHAHESGIIHRDLKPENIMITKKGKLKLMDFGIARVIENPGITTTGQILGSPAYMAPEIVRGKSSGKPSDIFGMGILLYQMCVGEIPFKGTNPHAVLVKIAEVDFEDPESIKHDIGTYISKLINKCLSKNPEDRPESTGELLKTTEKLLEIAGIKSSAIDETCTKLLLNPEKIEPELKVSIVNSLIKYSHEQKNKPIVHQIISRLLYLAPENEEIEKLWNNLHHENKEFPVKTIVFISLFVLLLSTLLFFRYFGKTDSNFNSFSKSNLNNQFYLSNYFKTSDGTDYIPYTNLVDSTHIKTNNATPIMNSMIKNMGVMNKFIIKHTKMMNKTIIKSRIFKIVPFPKGQVSIFLNKKKLGKYGFASPLISSIKVGRGKHILKLTHPFCYSAIIVIPPNLNSGIIRRRLQWRPARISVKGKGNWAVITTLEGGKKSFSGKPNSILDVPFPKTWGKSVIKAKVTLGGKEKIVYLKAGKKLIVKF